MRRTIASLFGVGLLLGKVTGSDAGSGTLGAAVGLAAGMAAGELGWPAQLLLAVLVAGVSVWASHPFSDDPGWVVVDEAAGATLAVVGLGLAGAVAGWVMFRIVGHHEDRLSGREMGRTASRGLGRNGR